MDNCDVAVIGAGPYGLSVAAHLKAQGVDFHIFGEPMEFWLKHMPAGMHLKSEGFASSLFDSDSQFPLKAYCKERNLPYADSGIPVSLETFSSYGLEFQKRYVPDVDRRKVTALRPARSGFEITLDDGKSLTARRVVVAVGLTYFEYMPQELASLPAEVVSHSSKFGELDQFKGREVAIVGAGASALDLAALLHEAGASVQVVARVPKIRFHDPPNLKPKWFDRIRVPATGIGLGWKLWLCANLPLVFRLMPEPFRIEKVRRILGPAPCWFIKDRVVGKVGFILGSAIKTAMTQNGRVRLELSEDSGGVRVLDVDHIISATGYRPDLRRLPFLDLGMISKIRCVGNVPALSSKFESTVPNLYFIGITAANTFGPLLRFAFGAGFAAPRLSAHLAHTARRYRELGRSVQIERSPSDSKALDSVAE